MTDRLRGPVAKLDRAKEHVDQLACALTKMRADHPHVVGRKENHETQQIDWVIVDLPAPPDRIAGIIGDVVHNLRSALDLTARQLVLDNGATPVDSGRFRTCFPIMDTKEAFEADGMRHVNGACKKARDVLQAVRPYKGGNDALWKIHKLDIVDKHRLLVTVGDAVRSLKLPFPKSAMDFLADAMGVAPGELRLPDAFYRPEDRQFPLKKGDVVLGGFSIHDPPYDDDVEFRFEVALNEPGVVTGEAVGELLSEFVQQVEGVLNAFRPTFKP